jgi:hypothetical protein
VSPYTHRSAAVWIENEACHAGHERKQHMTGHYHAPHTAGDASSTHQEAAVERGQQVRVFGGSNGRLRVSWQ